MQQANAQKLQRQQILKLRKEAEAALLRKDYATATLLLEDALTRAELHYEEQVEDLQSLLTASAAGKKAAAQTTVLIQQADMHLSVEAWEEAVQLSEQAVVVSGWHETIPTSLLVTYAGANELEAQEREAAAKAQREAAHAGELGRRLKAAGAMVGNLTCSLMWDDHDDLDLHCETPSGEHIFWNHKRGQCGGHLDVDMNASDKHLTDEGCENIYWTNPPPGHYKFWVENNQERDDQPTPFTVRLLKNGQVEEKTFTDLEEFDEQSCFEFDLEPQGAEGDSAKAAAAAALQSRLEQQAMAFAEDADALHNGLFTLRLSEGAWSSARECHDRARNKRAHAAEVASLQRSGEKNYLAGEKAAAEEDWKQAKQLAEEHGIDTSRLGHQEDAEQKARMKAMELTQAGVKKFAEGELDAAAKKFEEALTVCTTAGQARDWKSKVEAARHDTTTAGT